METCAYHEDYARLDSHYQDPEHLMFKKMQLVLKNVQPGKKLLDIGCGSGEILRQLKDKYESLIGLDTSSKSIEYAQEKLRGIDNVHLQLQDPLSNHLKFKNEQFDCCFCLDVLEHLESPYDIIREIFRVMEKKGRIFITVPNWYDVINSRILRRNRFHLTAHTPWGWMHLLRKCGFNIESCRAIDFPILHSEKLSKQLFFLGMCIMIIAQKPNT